MKKSFWILMVLAVLVVVFSVQNAASVNFKFFIWEVELSLAILLISAFIAGALVGATYYAVAMRQKRKNKDKNIAKDISFKETETVNGEIEEEEVDDEE